MRGVGVDSVTRRWLRLTAAASNGSIVRFGSQAIAVVHVPGRSREHHFIGWRAEDVNDGISRIIEFKQRHAPSDDQVPKLQDGLVSTRSDERRHLRVQRLWD